MTPDQFQSQSEAWISALQHVAIFGGKALVVVGVAGYGAWLKWGGKIKTALAVLEDCKKRLDAHESADTAAKLAAPAAATPKA